ncbi:MAG TPA: helix-turn-helix transcriptional regulator [Bradyrhizobium sp.]|nr:helix-turn-helix transcriptional regulator [Bradyrhizobium sp.]
MPATSPNPVDVHVGERVRMWRTARKISRVTLGDALGLSDQQIQKYETGANRIGASRLQQICAVLEIPVSFLFESTPGPSPRESAMPQDIADFMKSPEGVRFVAAFSRITDGNTRRGITRLAGRTADHVQPAATADVQLKKAVDEPADK